MLDGFVKKGDDFDIVSEDSLRVVVRDIFQEVGLPPEDAIIATDVWVTADLRGVETHGVSNLLRSYVQRLRAGNINVNPQWKIINETPTTANIDADRGHGIVICPKAMDIAIEPLPVPISAIRGFFKECNDKKFNTSSTRSSVSCLGIRTCGFTMKSSP